MRYTEKLNTLHTEALSRDAIDRMGGLAKISDMTAFKRAAKGIKKELMDEGFERAEVLEFLYMFARNA